MAKYGCLVVTGVLFLASLNLAAEPQTMSDDPDYERLATHFVVEDDGATLSESEVMERFLGLFEPAHANKFSSDDRNKIIEHRDSWLADLLAITNESNQYNYEQLKRFENYKITAGDQQLLIDYIDEFEKLEAAHQARITAHNTQLISSLSKSGSDQILSLLDDIRESIRFEISSGLSKRSKTDMKALARAHPAVFAKQISIEINQRKNGGPPPELVYETQTVATMDDGSTLNVMRLVPKGEVK